MDKNRRLTRKIISLCLSVFTIASIAVNAYAASGKSVIFGLPSGRTDSLSEQGEISEASIKERLDECKQKYLDYQKESQNTSNVGTTMPDGFSLVRIIDGEIRQVQVFAPSYSKAKNPENSFYSPLEDYSMIYYFKDELPYFALCYYENTKPREEMRFYLSQGEIIQWVDEDGEESSEAPEEFFFIYDHALSAYARAMYDRYDKGKYAIQVGSFKDKELAEECCTSLIENGQDARVKIMDSLYCVLIGEYKDWDKAAEAFEDVELTEECGITYIRLL